MFKLIKYLKDYKKESIIGPLFKLLEACLELIVPIVMANIIDVGIKNGDSGYILRMAGVLVFFGVLGLCCSLTAQYFAAKAAYGFGTQLRRDFFAHVNSLSCTELDEIGTSTLITRITSDINQAQSGVNLVLRLFLRSPFIVIGALIASFMIDVKMAMIFLISVPLMALVIYTIMAVSIPLYKKAQKKLDGISLITRENLVGIRVIRAFSKQRTEEARFEDANDDLRHTQLLVGKISALMNPLTYVIVNLAIVAVIWNGAGQVNLGNITQGEVIALVNYMTQILLALVALATLIVTFTKALASGARIYEALCIKTTMEDTAEETVKSVTNSPKVEFRGVSFAYHQAGEYSLEHISFSVRAGETVGIIGGTGSGKSTLVNLISRFYDVSQGTVFIDGTDVRKYPFSQLRRKIGMVPQKAVLFKGTIRENMKWGDQQASDEDIYRALTIAQAIEFVQEKPEKLDEPIAQGGKNLSGGQRQRLTIARALVGNPEILILDDSASALDFATDAALRKAIAQETQNMTVFIVSQRAAGIRHADKIIVLDDGKMAGIGRHEELIKTCDVYREICLSQLSKEEVGA